MEVLKDLKEALSEKTTVSRRGFLKGLGAFSATAAIYGCGGGGQSSYSSAPAVGTAVASAADNLTIDPALTTVMISHPYNCGGRCAFKVWVKNGVMMKITSGFADTPANTTTAPLPADESVSLPQFRGCMRGYSQIKRTYQPDRLKTPMMQTISRGNLRGFTSISWDQAYDTIAGWYTTTVARKSVLGYIPATGGVFNYFGPAVSFAGSPSTDNMAEGVYGTIGSGMTSNGLPDMLNSKFILNIGGNVTVSFTHQFPSNWYFTKAKEAGIPIVTLDPLFTDAASTLSTGFPQYNLPAYINPRNGTDAALFAAMAVVIYANNLHNTAFIKQYCFGFYPGDTVVSQGTFKNPITGVAAAGQTFTTPTGMSFVEYLTGLMTTYGGVSGVLNWASQITGVPAATIQNLGIAYATTKPSFIYGVYGGSARSVGGYYIPMMAVALAAMTGQSNLVGGGPGVTSCADPTPVSLGATTNPTTTATSYGAISCSAYAASNVMLTGTDNRTFAQLRADVLALNKIDLGAYTPTRNDATGNDGRLRVEMIAIHSGNEFNQRRGPMSRLMYALQPGGQVKYTYGMDHFITPTLAMCDIILPETCHHEYDSFQSKPLVYYFSNKVIPAMYQSMDSGVIAAEILNRLGIKYGIYGPQGTATARQLMAQQWAGAKIAAGLLAINPTATLPAFETFSQQGIFQLPEPPANAPLGAAATLTPGKFATDTGKINFFSPFYFYRDQALGSAYQHPDGGYYRSAFPPKAMYGPPVEGFDPVSGAYLGYRIGAKIKNGQPVRYTLQHNQAHHRRRAHSVYDNVALLKENFPAVATMNTADAAARGISNGDTVYVYNDWGCNKVKTIVSNRVSQGTIHIGDGEWYRASMTETYQAWFDTNGDGIPEMHSVPVDVGGAPNNLQPDRDVGPKEPAVTFDNSFHGNFVEVSLTHPDS